LEGEILEGFPKAFSCLRSFALKWPFIPHFKKQQLELLQKFGKYTLDLFWGEVLI
jgi:hypothetical protein